MPPKKSKRMFKVGITGGIGSGKSTVCRLFAARGIAVYDSDSEAKRLMNSSEELRARIEARFGTETYRDDGTLDRARLARIVFSDPQALADLDRLVHPAVRADFAAWAERQPSEYVILESAILFEAGFASEVDRTVAVLAPLELRVERTCRRDGCDAESVRRRIAAQTDDDTLCARADFSLVNTLGEGPEPAVETLDRRFRHEARNR